MSPVMIYGAAFLAVAAAVFAVYTIVQAVFFGNQRTLNRLQVITGQKTAAEAAGEGGVLRKEVFREGLQGFAGFFSNFFRRFAKLTLLIEQADAPISGNTFFLISGGCGLVGVLVSAAMMAPIPIWPVSGLFFSTMPLMWLFWKRKKKMSKFAKQLPDSLELIGRALRSGHSLQAAMKVVVEEMPAPISTEFGVAYEAQNLNVPIEQALKDMHRRVPNMDLRFFATAVTIQRQAGGDLAEILDKIGHIVRERFRILGQVQALTGEGRISGIVLMGLPIVLFFAVYYLNPEYVMVLFTDPLGRKMVAVAIFLQILGAICIKKIVNIKV